MNSKMKIIGMDCTSCALNIERKLKKSQGILIADVSYAQEALTVEYDNHITSIEEIKNIVKDLGYQAIADTESSENLERIVEKQNRQLKMKVAISTILSLLILWGTFGLSVFTPQILKNEFTILFLTIPIQFIIGFQFYRNSWVSLKSRVLTMDILIAAGTTAAFLFSASMTLFPQIFMDLGISGHYFDVSAVVITLVLIGRYLEAQARKHTGAALKKLIGLQPQNARKYSDGEYRSVPISQVVIDDQLQIKPGDKIPVDGVIIEGTANLDESMLTGEPLQKEKVIGDWVFAGTLNGTTTFVYQAKRVGSKTMLASIITLVQNAQASQAPIQKLADAIAGKFVPIVLVIATATFGIWALLGPQPAILYAILNAVGVLVIACPCALGLATPTAVIVGTGVSAQHGILIKNAEKLEKLQSATVIVFDKTGTLTYGTPRVINWITLDGENNDLLMQYVASAEAAANHPLATAIVTYAKANNVKILDPSSAHTVVGKGVKATFGMDTVTIGASLIESAEINEDLQNKLHTLQAGGTTVVPYALNGKVKGIIEIADVVRSEAKSVIKALDKQKIKSILLTGDNKVTAQALANQLGITNVVADVLPQDKQEVIKKLQSTGEIVVMVGDGINDAPALAASDVGISMGSGTDIAIETADVTLLGSDLRKIPQALTISKQVMKTITQNLFWAFGYNIILIPVAAGILYPINGMLLNPMLASLAMAFSSISVVLNSLRLNTLKLREENV